MFTELSMLVMSVCGATGCLLAYIATHKEVKEGDEEIILHD